MRRPAPTIALTIALAACSKEPPPNIEADEVVVKMREQVSRICACADRACADQAQADFASWGADYAKRNPKPRPHPEVARRVTDLTGRYADCLQKLAEAVPPPPPPSPPPAPKLPEVPPAPIAADRLLAAARAWAASEHPGLQVRRVDISYVDAAGVLDPTDGEVAIDLGNVNGDDDPKRRTGAPVRAVAKATECPHLEFHAGVWTVRPRSCGDALPAPPHCSTVELWKRALAKGAPSDAVAVLTLDPNPHARVLWRFEITDAPRNVSFTQLFADDCATAVEAQ